MKSHFQLFSDEWNDREDFPLILDVKFALLQIQSHVYSQKIVHPFFNEICEIINKNEKSIVKRSLEKLEPDQNLNFIHTVNVYVFEAMIPEVINHIKVCNENNKLEDLTNIPELNDPVTLRDAVFYIWMRELPNNIWLPIYADHEAIENYQNRFDTLNIKHK